MNETGDPEADRARVGDYVRWALPRVLEARGIDWPCSVDWDDTTIRAHLTRGELVIPTFERNWRWWLPVTKETGNKLAELLAENLATWWRKYRDADESGRLHFQLWEMDGTLADEPFEGARLVRVTLAPGCRWGSVSGGSSALVYRLAYGYGIPVRDAIGLGWVEVGGGGEVDRVRTPTREAGWR